MRLIDLEELKQLQLEILNITSSFCDEFNINYWLDGGTLLGAIRHNGYIPWDDDIDIGMLRPDFDRFIREFNGFNKRYIVKCIDTYSDFYYPFAKVLDTNTIMYEPNEHGNKLNVNIDIFVYDQAPNTDAELRDILKLRDFYRTANWLRTLHHKPNGSVFRRGLVDFLRLCVLPFPKNYFAVKMSANAKRYNNDSSKKVGNFVGFMPFTCDKRVFNSFTTHVFEGKRYKVPVGYDEWLTEIYGDYMQLPPPEKRVSHHTFKAYLLDN